jgi:hypothetical protein
MADAAGSGVRPRLAARAATARASARRYHQRLLRSLERKPYTLTQDERDRRRLLLVAGIGVMMVFATWCTVRSVPIIEADVDARVTRLLQREGIAWVQHEVFLRQVRLFGIAPSADARARAIAAIEGLDAVETAADHLVIAPAPAAPPETAGEVAAAPTAFVLSFDGAQLTLSGQVGDEESTATLLQQAERRYTRDRVVTELTLVESSSPAWRGAASAAVSALALLDAGRAVLADGRLTVSGAAPDATTLSALLGVLDARVPAPIELRADVVPIYRRARPDPAGCRRALDIIVAAGEIADGPAFSGLTRDTRTTLDQIARLVQSCEAGLLVLVPVTADEAGTVADRLFAEDVRQYLIDEAAMPEGAVALADAPPGARSARRVSLRLVLPDNGTDG